MQTGLFHLYEGDGKGKTTAAMGLALRALGAGQSVVIVQFLKGTETAEIPLLAQLGAHVFRGVAGDKFVFQMTPDERMQTRTTQDENLRQALTHPCDLLILDEACSACQLGMVDEELLQTAILHRPSNCEVVATGRSPAQWMVDAANYHTAMTCHRHPYARGIPARKGIEF